MPMWPKRSWIIFNFIICYLCYMCYVDIIRVIVMINACAGVIIYLRRYATYTYICYLNPSVFINTLPSGGRLIKHTDPCSIHNPKLSKDWQLTKWEWDRIRWRENTSCLSSYSRHVGNMMFPQQIIKASNIFHSCFKKCSL